MSTTVEDTVRSWTPWTSSTAGLWTMRLLFVFVLVTVTVAPLAVFVLTQTLDQSQPQMSSLPNVSEAIQSYPTMNLTKLPYNVSAQSDLINFLNGSKLTSPNSSVYVLDSMAGSCKPPFVAYQTYYCVPSCPADDTSADRRYVIALNTFSNIRIAIQYVCSFLVFYTWTRVKELRTFSHMATILMMLSYFVSVMMFTLPLIAGRKRSICSADDIITHYQKGPTKFCVIQGAMIHFSLMSSTVLFCCSVFNVTVAVLTFSTDNVIKRHSRVVFVIQCLLAVAIPGSLVGYALGTSSYVFLPLTFSCFPASVSVFFFSVVLPAQIVCVCTTVMVILIIRRIRQSNALRNSIRSTNHRATIAQSALTKRFMIIAVVFPFIHVFFFTHALVYNIPSLKRKITVDIDHYTRCLLDAVNSDRSCSSTALMNSFALSRIFDMIIFGLIGVIVLLYNLVPNPAIQFWASSLKRLWHLVCSLKRRGSGDVRCST